MGTITVWSTANYKLILMFFEGATTDLTSGNKTQGPLGMASRFSHWRLISSPSTS